MCIKCSSSVHLKPFREKLKNAHQFTNIIAYVCVSVCEGVCGVYKYDMWKMFNIYSTNCKALYFTTPYNFYCAMRAVFFWKCVAWLWCGLARHARNSSIYDKINRFDCVVCGISKRYTLVFAFFLSSRWWWCCFVVFHFVVLKHGGLFALQVIVIVSSSMVKLQLLYMG